MRPRTYQVNPNYNISLPVYIEIRESEKISYPEGASLTWKE